MRALYAIMVVMSVSMESALGKLAFIENCTYKEKHAGPQLIEELKRLHEEFDLRCCPKPNGPIHDLGLIDPAAALIEMATYTEQDWLEEAFRQKKFKAVHGQTQTIPLLWKESFFDEIVELPRWIKWEALFQPVLSRFAAAHNYSMEEVDVWKAMLAKVPSGAKIRKHRDRHPPLTFVHRVHWVLVSGKNVVTRVDDTNFTGERLGPGQLFELNNVMEHMVVNEGTDFRVHALLDIVPKKMPGFGRVKTSSMPEKLTSHPRPNRPGQMVAPSGNGGRDLPVDVMTKDETCAALSPALQVQLQRTSRVILASHNRLGWFNLTSGAFTVIHEGDGVYHGIAAGRFTKDTTGVQELATVWAVQRPHNVGRHATPGVSTNSLMHLELPELAGAGLGKVLEKQTIDSQFTHECAQHGDDIYVADTGQGRVLRYRHAGVDSQPWTLQRVYQVFTRKEHVNSLSLLEENRLLAMLMNSGRGQSFIAVLDLVAGTIVDRYENLGQSCHGCSPWREYIIYLESNAGALVKMPQDKGKPRRRVFEDDTKPKARFAKGLLVIGDIAIFGLSKPLGRGGRADPTNNADVVVFDLIEERVLLRAAAVETRGLLNAISAPELHK